MNSLYKATTIAAIAIASLTACAPGASTQAAQETSATPTSEQVAAASSSPAPTTAATLQDNFKGEWTCSGGGYSFLRIKGTALLNIEDDLSWEAQWVDAEALAVKDDPKNTVATGRLVPTGSRTMTIAFDSLTYQGKTLEVKTPSMMFANLTATIPETPISVVGIVPGAEKSETYQFSATKNSFTVDHDVEHPYPLTCKRS